MKKSMMLLVFLLLCASSATALGEGVTLKTTSIFAKADAAASIYASLLKAWQEQTGNTIVDSSAPSDEAWKASVLNDFAAGNEADVLFFFAKTADSAPILSKVVPISEINAAYPDLNLPETDIIAEQDGKVYAIPVRIFWEGLFCNVDLFEKYDVDLPTTWEKLEAAIVRFNQVGIIPISASFSDVPNYVTEFCILASGSVADHRARPAKGQAVPDSWVEGMRLLRRLYQLHAFPADVNATTNDIIGQLFREKKAAMQMDGSWFANSIHPESMDSTIVLPFPVHSQEANPTAYIGGVSMGFYLTRAAWEDDTKRDAAVDLLAFLTTGENVDLLGGYTLSGRLQESAQQMQENATAVAEPFQDVMDPSIRATWFSRIPSIADGTLDPSTMWQELMALGPFGD